MKVKELIDELSKFNGELDVYCNKLKYYDSYCSDVFIAQKPIYELDGIPYDEEVFNDLCSYKDFKLKQGVVII